MTKRALTYCGRIAREHDPDRFLVSLMAPDAARQAIWCLLAFNYEIARARESVSETMLGRIRLQWWREAIARIYEGGIPPEHPVVENMAEIIKKHQLPRIEFETLIDAREFDMDTKPHATLAALIDYADATSSPLTRLCLQVSGEDTDDPLVNIISVNYALAGLLRALPFLQSQGRELMVPEILREDIAAHFVYDVKPYVKMLKAMQKLAGLYMKQLENSAYNSAAMPPVLFKEIRVLMACFI